jgi:hypothetical protein
MRKTPVEPGKRFGHVEVLERGEKNEHSQFRWTVKCDCGKTFETWGYNLVKGVTTSCGCMRQKIGRRKRGTVEGRSPATLKCRICRESFATPREMVVHEERHKPVKTKVIEPGTNRVLSTECSGGCGRHFMSMVEYRDHSPVCDGSAPLPATLAEEPEAPGASKKSFSLHPPTCPECNPPAEFSRLEELSAHLERHREVKGPVYDPKSKTLMSRPCPHDCGRHFISKAEYKDHTALCDGSPPIVKINEEAEELKVEMGLKLAKKEDGMLKCPDCPKTFERPAALGAHRRWRHGRNARSPEKDVPAPAPRRAARGPQPVADPQPAPVAAPNGSNMIELLREKAAEHRRKADRLEEMAVELESLL